MSKYERLLIYPLLILALGYGFLGNPSMQASQETAVFNRIEVSEIVIKNDDGEDIINMGSIDRVMGRGDQDGMIEIKNNKGERGVMLRAFPDGGLVILGQLVSSFYEGNIIELRTGTRFDYGFAKIEIGNPPETYPLTQSGGSIEIFNDRGERSVFLGQTEGDHGGIWVYDRYGEYPAFYGHRR